MSDLLTELQEAHRESPSWRLFGLCHQAATRIATLEAQLAERVRVKPLEWGEAIHGGWVALGVAGVYHVHVGSKDGAAFYFFTNPFDHEPNEFCSEAKAKAAAQADYERRIKSALEEVRQ